MQSQSKPHRTYQALRDQLAERIQNGVYSEYQKLPSERLLAEELDTTRLTLRDALFQLEIEGKVFRMDRRGWFISGRRLVFDPYLDKGFMTNVHEQGMTPDTKLLKLEEIKASSTLAKALKLAPGAGVYHLQRQRFINKRPVLVEDIYLDQSRFPGLRHTDINGSLSLVLKEVYSVSVAYSHIEITPVVFNALHAKQLQVSPGTPATLITRTSFDSQGLVVEYDKEYWVADILKIELATQSK
ncbi:UTRA domain-containing protein [Bowmanella pacifica]|uniref:Transcriptional regulator n=1 Tax=Bowmanella pacifica TaxID=502051 RepID=A0A917YT41_9ALTE|nr:UTRA domain-containing protein [Bowmanella pacifica]GGO65267.1 transcriptional regulator [Bowmanella pacifica]